MLYVITRTSWPRPVGVVETAAVNADAVLRFRERTRNQYRVPGTSRTGVSWRPLPVIV